MNLTSKYTPALKFGSTDPQFTTDNPKWLAGIIGRATEAYSSDTDGGMALDFMTFQDNSGADGGPTTRMTIDQDGAVGIGTESPMQQLHVVGSIRQTHSTSAVLVSNADGDITSASNLSDVAYLQTVAVDGVTITGDGTPGNPLVAAGGGGGGTPGGNPGDVQINDGAGGFGPAVNLLDIAYQEQGTFLPPAAPPTPTGALPDAWSPAPANPVGWVEILIGGVPYYLPAYQ